MSPSGKHKRSLEVAGEGAAQGLRWGDLKSTREGLADFFRRRGMVVGSKKLTRKERAKLSLQRREDRAKRDLGST